MSTSDRVLGVAVAYVAAAVALGGRRGPTVCPFRLLTRRPCPACGLTRSVGRTARADLSGARAHHAAGPAVLVGFVAAAAWRVGRGRVRPRRSPY